MVKNITKNLEIYKKSVSLQYKIVGFSHLLINLTNLTSGVRRC